MQPYLGAVYGEVAGGVDGDEEVGDGDADGEGRPPRHRLPALSCDNL